MDWILSKSTIQGYCGETLSNIRVTDLYFADDVTILSESLDALVAAQGAFGNELMVLRSPGSRSKKLRPDQFGHAYCKDIKITQRQSFTYLSNVVHTLGCQTRKPVYR